MKKNLTSSLNSIPQFLSGGGEMGQRIRDFDWSSTSLGPVEFWPASLRTCVQIMLTSSQPIWIGWGKELIKLYNDPYKAIVGGKHPWALGKPASVVWKEIWRDIEPMLDQVMYKNEGTYVEAQLLIMERNGYHEETYYTFSYTPIAGDEGETDGMICFNTDDTERILSERQLQTLTRLGKSLTNSKSKEEVCKHTITSLQSNKQDFPFALLYTLDQGGIAKLSSFTESSNENSRVPLTINLHSPTKLEQICLQACSYRKVQIIEDVNSLMGSMPKGVWNVSTIKAIALPIAQRGQQTSYGFIIIGLNPYRLLDEKFLSFYELVADQIAGSFNQVTALDAERKRLKVLSELDRAKTTFFSNISHEFRTPLTLLLGPIEDLLNDPNVKRNNKDKIEVAFRNALRMQKLVDVLLDFSKIEAGRMQARFKRVDIGSLTEDVASSFRSAIEKAGMQLIIKRDSIEEAVLVDADMWEKIILNLVSNAFKYSVEGYIEVSIKKVNHLVEVSVKDTGIGISEDEQEKIFERFYRVQNTNGRSQEGTGIGLALVRELVKLHGGTISVMSKEGKGSVFTVSLPLANALLEKRADEDQKNRTARPSAFVEEALQWNNEIENDFKSIEDDSLVKKSDEKNQKRFTILLADDNADMRKYVHRLFDSNYNVIVAADGEEAFVKIKETIPDLILSDIMMPKLDGFGLLEKVRTNMATRNIPVIFLSARAGEEAKVDGLNAGADDYLTKPFSSKELLARVNSRIAISQARRQTEKEFFNLFVQSPAHIHVFKGPDHVVEFFHPLGIRFIGKDITGMKIREALPFIESQGYFEMLDKVYKEGVTIQLNETKATFPGEDGKTIDYYFNITYLPWKNLEGKIQGVLQFSFEVTETVTLRLKAEANEKKFKSIAQQAPVAMSVLTGSDHMVKVANDRLLEMWGKTYEEVIDKSVLKIFPEIVGQGLKDMLDKVFTTGEPFIAHELPISFMRAGKEKKIFIDLMYEPFTNEYNQIEGIVAVGTDVTQQVQARNAVAEAEERLRIATETVQLGTWDYDLLKDIILCSKKTLELYGFVPGAKIGLKEVIKTIVDEDKQRVMEAIQWALNPESKGKYEIEYSLININDNKQRTIRANGQVFFDENNTPYRFIGTAFDITEQREAEQKIKDSEARFRLLANSIPQIVWITDKQGNTSYVSEQLDAYTGKVSGLTVDSAIEIVHPSDMEELGRKRMTAIENGTEWEHEYRMKNANGQYRWFSANAKPMRDSKGNIMMWVGSATDIHDLKEQSDLLEQQVQERTRALNELNQTLKLSNEDLQRFAHVASHDLKEPIRKIKTYGNRLKEDFKNTFSEKEGVYLNKILSATDRMYSMIDGVLLYSTMASIDQPEEEVDISQLMREIQNDLEVLISEKKATFEVDTLPVVTGAPVLLYQLFYNLTNNSIKFSKANESPLIEVKSSTTTIEGNPFWKIEFIDNGIGFDQEQADKIFGTFTRLNSKDKYEGTGLGLALCRKIVQRHKGFIFAKAEENKGACFTILLPINK
jgi:PAS domain S-box-containing protein